MGFIFSQEEDYIYCTTCICLLGNIKTECTLCIYRVKGQIIGPDFKKMKITEEHIFNMNVTTFLPIMPLGGQSKSFESIFDPVL